MYQCLVTILSVTVQQFPKECFLPCTGPIFGPPFLGRLFSAWRSRAGATAPSHNRIVRSITISHTKALSHSPAPAVFRIRHGTRETREFAAGKGPHARRMTNTVTAVRRVFCLVYESMRIITRIKIISLNLYAMVALV